jgi:hypothetical protein
LLSNEAKYLHTWNLGMRHETGLFIGGDCWAGIAFAVAAISRDRTGKNTLPYSQTVYEKLLANR